MSSDEAAFSDHVIRLDMSGRESIGRQIFEDLWPPFSNAADRAKYWTSYPPTGAMVTLQRLGATFRAVGALTPEEQAEFDAAVEYPGAFAYWLSEDRAAMSERTRAALEGPNSGMQPTRVILSPEVAADLKRSLRRR